MTNKVQRKKERERVEKNNQSKTNNNNRITSHVQLKFSPQIDKTIFKYAEKEKEKKTNAPFKTLEKP